MRAKNATDVGRGVAEVILSADSSCDVGVTLSNSDKDSAMAVNMSKYLSLERTVGFALELRPKECSGLCEFPHLATNPNLALVPAKKGTLNDDSDSGVRRSTQLQC
jgi:hypothetical protein